MELKKLQGINKNFVKMLNWYQNQDKLQKWVKHLGQDSWLLVRVIKQVRLAHKAGKMVLSLTCKSKSPVQLDPLNIQDTFLPNNITSESGGGSQALLVFKAPQII